MAVLKLGTVLFLMLLTTLSLAKDVPDAPLPPDIVCHPTEKKATVSWKEPNGFPPVTGYVITVNRLTSNLPEFKSVDSETSTDIALNVFANYTFRVAARNIIGIGPNSKPSVSCEIPSDVPERNPLRPGGQLTRTNELVITWTKMGINMHNGPGFFYRVYYKKASDPEWKNVTVLNWENEEKIVRLSPSTDAKYEIKVEAANAIGAAKQPPSIVTVSSPKAAIPCTPLPPDVQCNTEMRTATITWMAPNDNGSPIESYLVTETEIQANYWRLHSYDAEDVKNKTFDLTPGESYMFKVQAINSIGESSFSGGSTLCESSPDVPYRNPENVRGRITKTDKLVINWNYLEPWDARGPGFFYRVYFKKLSDDKWENVTIDGRRKRETQISVTRGKNDRVPSYEFKVEANNAIGAAKKPPKIYIVRDTFALPAAPSSPRRPDVDCHPKNSTATLSWKEPDNNGSPVIGYFITISELYTSNVDTTIFHDPANGTIKEFPLNPWTKYSFRVTAHNAIGLSPISEHSVSCETSPDVPYDNPTDILGRATDNNDLDIKWKPMDRSLQNGPGFFYRVYYRKTSEKDWKNITVLNWDVGETKINITWEPGEKRPEYEIKVQANNAIGSAKIPPESIPVIPFKAGVPNVPHRPVVECNSEERMATVTWKAPEDNGSPIINYNIEATTSEHKHIAYLIKIESINGSMRPGLNYSFRVWATNRIGPGYPSEDSDPCESSPDVPYSNPSGAYGYVIKKDNLVIKWAPMRPLEHNGPGFFYRVQFKKASDKVWEHVILNNWNDTETRVNISWGKDDELPTYEVKVEANNQLGPASAPPEAFIAHKGEPQVPYSPLNVQVECDSAKRSATVQWDVPENNGFPILGYKVIKVDESNTREFTWSVPGDQTHYDISLTAWTKHTFEVVARGPAGDSVPSRPSTSCMAHPDVPYENPSVVNIQGTEDNNLNITWTPMNSDQLNGPGFFYRVYFKTSLDQQWRNVTIEDFKVGEAIINLDDKKTRAYDIKVEANNIIGAANWSPSTFIGYNGEGVPLQAPDNVVLDELLSDNGASFSWNPVPKYSVPGHFEGYKVTYWSETPWSGKPAVVKVSPDVTHVKIYGLQPGATNYVQVWAMNKRFDGPPSNILTVDVPEILPGPVSYLHIAQMGSTTLGLRWGKPHQPNGHLLGYKLVYQKVNGSNLGTEIEGPSIQDGNITSTRIRNLEPETNYRVTISPINSVGEGTPYFDERETGKYQAEEPKKPSFRWKFLKQEQWKDGLPAIQVTWVPGPIGNAGTHFYVAYKKSNETQYTTTVIEKHSDDIIVTGLDPTADYDVKVVAIFDKLEKASDAVRVQRKFLNPIKLEYQVKSELVPNVTHH